MAVNVVPLIEQLAPPAVDRAADAPKPTFEGVVTGAVSVTWVTTALCATNCQRSGWRGALIRRPVVGHCAMAAPEAPANIVSQATFDFAV